MLQHQEADRRPRHRRQRFGILLVMSTLVTTFPACISSDESSEDASRKQAIAPSAGQPTAELPPTRNEAEMNKREIARLQSELQTMREQVKTVERNLELVMRGQRSGIYDDEKPPETSLSEPKTQVTESATPAADKVVETEPTQDVQPANDEKGNAPMKRVAAAELKMQRGQYAEAAEILSELQRTTPNLGDQGASLLLLADCQNHMQQYDNALSNLQSFYLRYPGNPDTRKAKLLEAQAQEGVGAKERALRVYREIIATGPHSPQAETARSAMQRLRDEK